MDARSWVLSGGLHRVFTLARAPAVAHKRTGEVWLEGALERGVVPEECAWTAGGGAGEDGCLLLLQKMNLELLRRCARLE